MSGARHTEYLRQAHIQGDLGLNICEAHAFNTSDRFSLDIFVVDGWKADGSKESLEQALSSRFAQVAPSAQGPRGDGAAAQPANAADSRSRVRSCKAAPDCHPHLIGQALLSENSGVAEAFQRHSHACPVICPCSHCPVVTAAVYAPLGSAHQWRFRTGGSATMHVMLFCKTTLSSCGYVMFACISGRSHMIVAVPSSSLTHLRGNTLHSCP